MTGKPIVYETSHQVSFSDLDPYGHMTTGRYATYFTDHRMQGLSENLGWTLPALEGLPFMAWVRRMEIDFIRSARPDQKIVITSFVRDFRGPDALVECSMLDSAGKVLALCVMIVAYVEKATSRAADWPSELQALFFHDGPSTATP